MKRLVRFLANIVRGKKKPESLKKFLICPTKAENREGRDFNLKDLRNLSKSTLTSRGT